MRRSSRPASEPPAAGRVLVVEDDAAARAMLRAVLEEEGYAVLAAGDGSTALALLEVAAPDVVLLDLRPPSMDGHAFARRYRRMPGPHAPLVVLSADADGPAPAGRFLAGHVGGPFDVERLLAVVGRAVQRRRAAA
jgi:CheY-like chemotaxis protein